MNADNRNRVMLGVFACVVILALFYLQIPQSQWWLVQQYNASTAQAQRDALQKQINEASAKLAALDDAVKKLEAVTDKTTPEALAEKARIQKELDTLKPKPTPPQGR